MLNQYILEPFDKVAKKCSEVGRFPEDDYRMAMSSSEVPESYWTQVGEADESDRKIVIVGAQSVPMATTKSAFLAQTLAKPKKLTIKAPSPDEAILIRETLEYNKEFSNTEFFVYENKSEELKSDGAWLRDLEEATDVVVFGGQETVSFFDKSYAEKASVHLHGPKFSFGIVDAESLESEDNLAGLAGDFLSYYGEGCLSPRFYITIGDLTDDQMTYLVDCMKEEEEEIKEFRSKLPLSKKSLLVQQMTNSNYLAPYIRVSSFDSSEYLTPLFGDIRLINVDDPFMVEAFTENFESMISTIALEEEELGDLVAGWEVSIPRYCDIGSMQFPYFYEKFDVVDDFEIYGGVDYE